MKLPRSPGVGAQNDRGDRRCRRRSLFGRERSSLSDIKHIPLANLVMITSLNQIEMDVTS
jgi:hypothetical protein